MNIHFPHILFCLVCGAGEIQVRHSEQRISRWDAPECSLGAAYLNSEVNSEFEYGSDIETEIDVFMLLNDMSARLIHYTYIFAPVSYRA